jgi:protein SCO1/2
VIGPRSARARRPLLAAAVLAVAVMAAGCSAVAQSPNSDRGPFHGVDMRSRSLGLTARDLHARFRSTSGGPTSLADQQSGRVMLLYFGYTHCPDVCPTTMADLAGALSGLPAGDQGRVQVVFVTSDPTRDSPAVMRAWLAHFDGGLARPFVGLTASNRRIDALARTLHILIAPPVHHRNGRVTVAHGAETIAFLDGKAQVLWSSDTPPGDYASDLQRLLTAS